MFSTTYLSIADIRQKWALMTRRLLIQSLLQEWTWTPAEVNSGMTAYTHYRWTEARVVWPTVGSVAVMMHLISWHQAVRFYTLYL